MKALVCQCLSDDLSGVKLLDIPQPTLTSNLASGAIIRIKAAAINWPDYLMTKGEYQFKPQPPFILGMEAAGIIEQASDDCPFAAGEEVIVNGKTGSICEFSYYPSAQIQPKYQSLSFEQAAGFNTAFSTAWGGLVERGHLSAGQTVLIHGASGGVGMAAVILAKWLNCFVIATATSAEKIKVIEAWGADAVLDVSDDKLSQMPAEVKRLTAGKGVNLVYDPVGGQILNYSLRCVDWNAKICIIGFAAGNFSSLPSNLILIKGLDVYGVRAGEMGRRNPQIAQRMKNALTELANRGCKPHIGATYNINDSRSALQSLSLRKTIGKTIVTI